MAHYSSMSKRWDFATFQREMQDPDPDKPHQALFDINQDLEKPGFHLDEGVQRQVFSTILHQALNSCHSDVQGAAVKCIPNLVKKVKENSILDEVLMLTERMDASKKEQRDIATISLKYLIDNIPFEFRNCVKLIAVSLVRIIPNASEDMKLDIIDVITDLVKRFGSVLTLHSAKAPNEDGIQAAMLASLNSKNLSVRKKAITCIAACSVHSSEPLFQHVMSHVTDGIAQQHYDKVRRYIQLCSAISRVAGERVGTYLPNIMPLLMANLDEAKLEAIEEDHERIEVKENILQAYEAFVTKCPHQVTPFIDHILEACRTGMSHDPYYDYDCDVDGDVEMEEEEDDEYADMLEADCDDDDDVSWKVRKTSAKCLSAIVVSRPDCLHRVYDAICSKAARERDITEENPSNRLCLPERFKEREESVRLDIFRVFGDLLSATAKNTAPPTVSNSFSNSRHLVKESRPEVRHLVDIKDFIVDSIVKASKDKSMKVKTVCFQHLTAFAALLGPELVPMTGKFLAISKETLGLKEATSALKTEVLQFLQLLVLSCKPMSQEAEAILSEVLPLVLQCVSDRYYKIIVESLKVCGSLAQLIASSKHGSQYSAQVFGTVFDRLSVTDVDQEVKDSAIATMGNLLRHFAGSKDGAANLVPQESVSKAFQQLLVMFNHEFSRIPVMKALTATRDVPVDSSHVEKFMSEMCGFLRKSSRPLHQASLHCMKVIVERKAGQTPEALLTQILQELIPLLSDNDLHLAHLAVDLSDAILRCFQKVPDVLEKSVLPKFIELLKSPLLQGSALESLETMFSSLGQKSVMGYHPLLRMVLGAVGRGSVSEQRQVLASVAAVTARLTAQATEDQQAKTVEEYVSCLTQDDEMSCALGLACLGEIGKFVDLTTNPRVIQVVREKFYHPKEDIKLLTAAALGKIAYGNPNSLLPDLLSSIEKNDSNLDIRYLLLRALKEALAQADPHNDYNPLQPHLQQVYNICGEFAGHEDEGTRNVIAECLGKLAVLSPATTAKGLILAAEKAGATGEATATVITAMKYAVSEPDFNSSSLEDDVQFFLGFMKKPEGVDKPGLHANVKVRRAAVQLFTAAVHSKPELVRPHLRAYMKNLLDQCDVDNELINQVNLGPFVHKVDDGIEIRKSAFECIDILLDGHFSDGDPLLDYVNDYPTVAEQVANGMKQTQGHDIQILSFMMFCKLLKIRRAGPAVTSVLDKIFVPTLLGKVQERNVKDISKDNISKQDAERIGDLLFNMLKMVYSIKSHVPNAEENQNFTKFLSTVHLIPEKIVRAVQEQGL